MVGSRGHKVCAKIELIDGEALEELIGAVSVAAADAQIPQAQPAFPKCGGGVVEREPTRGRFVKKAFWGCQGCAKCTGIVRIS